MLSPTKCVKWLGYEIDLEKGQILVLREKITKLKELLVSARAARSLLAKTIASITGKIMSLRLAIGLVARLRTRALHVCAVLAARQSWCSILELSDDAGQEILFWLTSLHLYNGQPIWHSLSTVRGVYSDASHMGFGGY